MNRKQINYKLANRLLKGGEYDDTDLDYLVKEIGENDKGT